MYRKGKNVKPEANLELIEEYIKHPQKFRELANDPEYGVEYQLTIIADLILYFGQQKVDALRRDGKTRTDASVDAREYEIYERYWENQQTNVRRLAELENTRARRGI